MGQRISGLNHRAFEDYAPAVEWSHAADGYNLTISLPGFRRDELRLHVDNKHHLRVRAERPVEAGSTKWIRFNKDLMKLPDNSDIGGVRANFKDEKLTIKLPMKNRPSPPGSSAPVREPAQKMHEEDKDEQETMVGIEMADGRRLIDWILPVAAGAAATVATFVAITAYEAAQKEKKSRPSPPNGSASEPAPAVQEEEGKGRPSPPDGSAYAREPVPTMQEEKKSRPTPPDGSSSQPVPAVQEEEKSRPSPPSGSASDPALPLPPPNQEEKYILPSPPDASASELAPVVQEEEKSRPSRPNGFAPEQALGTQEEKKSRPSPPDGFVCEPAPKMQEEDEDEERPAPDGRRPIHWILVAVAAVSFVGITVYVVWCKLRCDHGPSELAGAGSYIDEM